MLDTAEPQVERPSTSRLVIRVKLIPREPPPPPVWQRPSKIALLLIAGVVAVLMSWVGYRAWFTPEPTLAPLPKPAAVTTVAKPVEPVPEVRPQPDAPTTAVNEVIPDVPRSALATIRGTIRVSVRVILDKRGMVVEAAADDRGPSRYFERLAVDASKKWTFTPANAQERRTMLVKFNFTRYGATADASEPHVATD